MYTGLQYEMYLVIINIIIMNEILNFLHHVIGLGWKRSKQIVYSQSEDEGPSMHHTVSYRNGPDVQLYLERVSGAVRESAESEVGVVCRVVSSAVDIVPRPMPHFVLFDLLLRVPAQNHELRPNTQHSHVLYLLGH